jgi:hypothetical protein
MMNYTTKLQLLKDNGEVQDLVDGDFKIHTNYSPFTFTEDFETYGIKDYLKVVKTDVFSGTTYKIVGDCDGYETYAKFRDFLLRETDGDFFYLEIIFEDSDNLTKFYVKCIIEDYDHVREDYSNNFIVNFTLHFQTRYNVEVVSKNATGTGRIDGGVSGNEYSLQYGQTVEDYAYPYSGNTSSARGGLMATLTNDGHVMACPMRIEMFGEVTNPTYVIEGVNEIVQLDITMINEDAKIVIDSRPDENYFGIYKVDLYTDEILENLYSTVLSGDDYERAFMTFPLGTHNFVITGAENVTVKIYPSLRGI